MNYIIYDTLTGQIKRSVITQDVAMQLQENESYIEGFANSSNFYVNNGLLVPLPPKPNEFYVFSYETKSWVLDNNLAIKDIKLTRNKLLELSDWTQIPNGPLTSEKQQEWAVYRQELRDITSQPGYPYNVVWPTPPTN
jgi:hypothetical protein